MADAQTGISIPYKGTRSIESLLKLVLERRGGEPIIENSNLMGIKREDGSRITLENGGAVEYASPSVADIASVMEFAQNELQLLAEDAARLGIALVSGANYPFNDITNANWMPKARGPYPSVFRLRGGGQYVRADSESFSANQGSVCNVSEDEPGQCRRVTVTVRCPTDTYLVSAIAHSSTHSVRANGYDDEGIPTGFETEDRSDYPAVTGDDFESKYIADSSDQPTGMKFHHWSSPLGQGESESGTVKLWITCAPEPEPLTVATEVACDENGESVLRVWATTAPGSLAFSAWIRTEDGSRSVSIPEGGGTDEPLEMTGGTATGGTVTGTFSDGQAVSESFTVSRPPCP